MTTVQHYQPGEVLPKVDNMPVRDAEGTLRGYMRRCDHVSWADEALVRDYLESDEGCDGLRLPRRSVWLIRTFTFDDGVTFQRCLIYSPDMEKCGDFIPTPPTPDPFAPSDAERRAAEDFFTGPQVGVFIGNDDEAQAPNVGTDPRDMRRYLTADDNVSIDYTFLLPVAVRIVRGVVVSAKLAQDTHSPRHVYFAPDEPTPRMRGTHRDGKSAIKREGGSDLSDSLGKPTFPGGTEHPETDDSLRARVLVIARAIPLPTLRRDYELSLGLIETAVGVMLDAIAKKFGLIRTGIPR